MWGYHVWYDLEIKKFVMDEDKTVVGRPNDFSHWFTDPKAAKVTAKKMNRRVDISVKKCRECHRLFWLDKDEQDWFDRHNLHLPTKCPTCRQQITMERLHEAV